MSTTTCLPLLPLTEVDEAILQAINRFHYLTADQLSRLFYPGARDNNRYSQRRLARLVAGTFLLRLRALPTPRVGSAPHVFTLADRGRRYLAALGIPLAAGYFRPSEERQKAENRPFMRHTLAVIDVLVQAVRLTRSGRVSLPALVTERELRARPVRIRLPGTPEQRSVAVIPDAWLQLRVGGEPAVSISLELDRATEDQQAWRRKVATLAAWAVGPYRTAFATDNLTIAVVTPDPARRDSLSTWTVQELEKIRMPQLADVFLFTSLSPTACSAAEWFFGRVWYPAGTRTAVSLLDEPPGVPQAPLTRGQVYRVYRVDVPDGRTGSSR